MDSPQAQIPVNIKSSECSNRGNRGGLGGKLELLTEIVIDSHGTICANDIFQSVFLCAEILALRLLACVTSSFCSNPFVYLTETAKKNILIM